MALINTCLPTWPFILFGILEPLALIWATITTILDPYKFWNDQVPNHPTTPTNFTRQAEAQTLQLGNIFLLLAAMAVICSWTKHREITTWYLVAVAVADWGHMYVAARGVGWEYARDITRWNDMFGGNFGVSAFLNVNRLLTVWGVFGRIGVGKDGDSKQKKRR